ncbi:MAG: class I SAM-dependent methyltransferase [Streptosporangiaceae bacterium]
MMSRWDELTGGGGGAGYAARFAALAAAGQDLHGEAALCAALVPPGSRVLDAGCGTGRVAIRLAELGYDCVGADLDASMLAEARRAAPDQVWIETDLADLDLGPDFDLVVAAGNVIPLLTPGTEAGTVIRLAAALRPGGLLVSGFGLDRAHLPVEPSVTLTGYDAFCAAAGLVPVERLATWDGAVYDGGAYAVSVHRRP